MNENKKAFYLSFKIGGTVHTRVFHSLEERTKFIKCFISNKSNPKTWEVSRC